MVAWEELTDRVEILRELDGWVKNIQRMASGSTAIISPRRLGKSVLLDRLVNTVFFKPEYKVVPFYFKMKREEITLREFILEYATSFYRQYIAYCLQDASLYQNKQVGLKKLIKIKSDHKGIVIAQDFIRNFLQEYYCEPRKDYNARIHWENFVGIPEQLASFSGTRVAVIIDEFQDMKFYIHNVDEQELKQIRIERDHNPDIRGTDLTASYAYQSQSRKAPMLVSGSAVTMIFRVVMGGPLGGRFDFIRLKPLEFFDGAALLHQVLKIYMPGHTITSENALYASLKVNGHPYYLYCLATSKYKDKSFRNKDTIERIIKYEIEQGKIYGFWQTHFENNRKYINSDDDESLGKKIIYYFTQYNNQPVGINAIAEKLKVPKKAVEQKIEKLYLADLVYRTKGRYYSFNDICLMRFIRFVYAMDLEGIDKIDLSERNLFNTLKGKFLEIVVQVTMMKFNHEKVPGKFWGKSGKIKVPLFQLVDSKYTKGFKTRPYQIDVYGKVPGEEQVWICECKYTQNKMGLPQVKKLEKAAQVLQQENKDSEYIVPQVQMWFVSTGGFTNKVLEYAQDRDDIYISDYEGINGIFQYFGGNYNLPIFSK